MMERGMEMCVWAKEDEDADRTDRDWVDWVVKRSTKYNVLKPSIK